MQVRSALLQQLEDFGFQAELRATGKTHLRVLATQVFHLALDALHQGTGVQVVGQHDHLLHAEQGLALHHPELTAAQREHKVLAMLEDVQFKALPVSAKRWYEIDDPNDLAVAETMFAEHEAKLTAEAVPWNGHSQSLQLALPPLAVMSVVPPLEAVAAEHSPEMAWDEAEMQLADAIKAERGPGPAVHAEKSASTRPAPPAHKIIFHKDRGSCLTDLLFFIN